MYSVLNKYLVKYNGQFSNDDCEEQSIGLNPATWSLLAEELLICAF